jgi:hypothetical protein
MACYTSSGGYWLISDAIGAAANPSEVAISCWLKLVSGSLAGPNPTGARHTLWASAASGDAYPHKLCEVAVFRAPGLDDFSLTSGLGDVTGGELVLDKWHHVIVLRSREGAAKAYLDGELVYDELNPESASVYPYPSNILSFRLNSDLFPLSPVSETAIYSQWPTESDIKSLAAGASPLMLSVLPVAYFPFNAITGGYHSRFATVPTYVPTFWDVIAGVRISETGGASSYDPPDTLYFDYPDPPTLSFSPTIFSFPIIPNPVLSSAVVFTGIASASEGRYKIADGVSGISVGDVATGLGIGPKEVAASNAIVAYQSFGIFAGRSVAASDTVTLDALVDGGINAATYRTFGHSSIPIASLAGSSGQFGYRVIASSGMSLAVSGTGGLPRLVGAASVLTISAETASHVPVVAAASGTGFARLSGIGNAATTRSDVEVESGFTITVSGSSLKTAPPRVDGELTVWFYDTAAAYSADTETVLTGSTLRISGRAAVDVDRIFVAGAFGLLSLESISTETTTITESQLSSLILTSVAASGRVFEVSATTSVSLQGPSDSNDLYLVAASTDLALLGCCDTLIGWPGCDATLELVSSAVASVQLPGGLIVPGGEQPTGPRHSLLDNVSSDYPLTYAETGTGGVLMANGIDRMISWNGMASEAWHAGVPAPADTTAIACSGHGSISGQRFARVRFVDRDGNVSNPSEPTSLVECGRDGWIESFLIGSAGEVTIRSRDHLLATGDLVTLYVPNVPATCGDFSVVVLDDHHFKVAGLVISSATLTDPGTWSTGAAGIVYSNVPVPTNPRIARRQILRNLSGQAGTLYVDIDTTDLESTTLTSSRTDAELATQESVTISFDDGAPSAYRHGTPPSHKAVIVSHAGRIFAAVDAEYTAGHCEVISGSRVVVGIGTQWTSTMVGRFLFADGAAKSHEISSIDTEKQLAVLAEPYSGATDRLCFYAIRPAVGERRLVYFSEPHAPESWPAWNAFAVPDCSDTIRSLAVVGSHLYIVESRHIHKFTFNNDPAKDGFLFMSAARGCVNHRCCVVAGGVAYMLDEAGIHAFSGDESASISLPIQSLFYADGVSPYQIDWRTDRTMWHASHDPTRETIRWFVDLVGHESLTTAICFDYSRRRWWLEDYSESITASCEATVGFRRSLAGTTARRVICLGEGSLDGIREDSGPTSGEVVSGTSISASVAGLTLASNLAGTPVVLVSRTTGRKQRRVVADNTSDTVTVVDAWDQIPVAGDLLFLGGVPWKWRSGWFRFADDELENPRGLEISFQPITASSRLVANMYFDYAGSPRVWRADRDEDGIRLRNGNADIEVKSSTGRGYAIQRLYGHRESTGYGDKYVSVELAGVQGAEPARIYQLSIEGASQ